MKYTQKENVDNRPRDPKMIIRTDPVILVFDCQKLLKSVNSRAVQEDYIVHRGLSEVR